MPVEIEHKFLVTSDAWRKMGQPIPVRQGFLSVSGPSRIRVRSVAGRGFITVKGKSPDGLSRPEYEYEIPVTEAEEMLDTLLVTPVIEKTRTCIPYRGHIVEVDEFLGENAGLIVAEIELGSPDEPFEVPSWLGKDVTHLHRYANVALAIHPFKDWSDSEKNGEEC